MSIQIPAIPSDFGDGGAYLAKGGAAGSPDLATILTAMRNAIIEAQENNAGEKGADLTNADVTITRAQGGWRVLPAATLTAGHTATLGVSDVPADGAQITITRDDLTANTYAVVNGGTGGGTLFTFPVSKAGWAKFQYDLETNKWRIREFAIAP